MRRPPPRHAQLHLPPLSGTDAYRLVALLEKAIRAIWRAHGDQMAEALARDFPSPDCLDEHADPEPETRPRLDDHDIDF